MRLIESRDVISSRGVYGESESIRTKPKKKNDDNESVKLTSTMLKNILLITLDPPLQLSPKLHRPQRNPLIKQRTSPNRLPSNMIPRHMVPQHHIEGSSRTSFLPIPLDVHPLRPLPSKHQPGHIVRVPVVIHHDLLILREQVLKISVRERVGVRTEGSEDHEIGDVHDPHSELWSDLAEESGGGDYFEGDFRADTDEDDVRTETVIGGAEIPHARTRSRVDLSLLWAEPNSRGMLRPNHQINIPLRVNTMGDRAQEAIRVWREVDTSGISLEVKNGADERRILVREPVVLLTGPGGGLEVVERSVQRSKVGLFGHLDEFGVLDHHRLCDADEGLVRWEQGCASSHRVALQHSWK